MIDVSNPASPYVAGVMDINDGLPGSLAEMSNYVYSSSLSGFGLYIIDVSNPANPILIDSLLDPPLYDVDVSGSYAYLIGHTFYVVDIANPSSPQVVWEDYAFGNAIDVSEPYAYVGLSSGPYGFRVFDISDPANPHIVGTLAMGTISDVAVAGPYAYIASDGLQVIDISDAENPQVVGSIDIPATRVVIDGSYAYVTGGIGLAVIDISNPENPQYVGEILNAPRNVDVSGGLVYCIGSDFSIYPVQCENGVANVDGTVLGDDIPPTGSRFVVYPNPFNPQVTVEYSIPQNEWADISIYDLTGRRVSTLASRTISAGPHTLTWNGRDANGQAMPSGTYIIRLEAESGVQAKKVMLLR